jgi:hypothetical protein
LPRHNCSSSLPSELPAELLSARLVWIRRRGAVPPLHPLYDSPFTVIRRGTRSFTLQIGNREEIVAISPLKACTTADAAPGSPRRRGLPPGKRPGGSAAAKRVTFQHPLVSTPSTAPLRNGPRTVFLPKAEVFVHPGRWHHQHLHSSRIRCASGHRREIRRGIRNASGQRLRGWISDLLSSQPRPELGGALWRPVLLASACTPVHAVNTHVHTLFINTYVILNKSLLS